MNLQKKELLGLPPPNLPSPPSQGFETGSQGRTDAVKNSDAIRADVAILVHNMLSSRNKTCTKGKAIERKRFKPASDTSVVSMYLTGYFLLGQVAVSLDGRVITKWIVAKANLENGKFSSTAHSAINLINCCRLPLSVGWLRLITAYICGRVGGILFGIRMKKIFQFIVIFLAGFFTCSVVERIISAKAEEKFRLERSRCQLTLIEQWKQSEGKAGLGTGDNGNYFFVDWSKLPDGPGTSPGKYPLIYDRRMSNHDGRGINILMVGGSIEWDSNADWLKKLAAEHPNVKLPMPE